MNYGNKIINPNFVMSIMQQSDQNNQSYVEQDKNDK